MPDDFFLKVSIRHFWQGCAISDGNRQYRSAFTNIKLLGYDIAALISIRAEIKTRKHRAYLSHRKRKQSSLLSFVAVGVIITSQKAVLSRLRPQKRIMFPSERLSKDSLLP